MDLRSSELDEPDPSSPLYLTSECEEPDTESDFFPPCKRRAVASQSMLNNVISPSSSSVCSPDSDSESSESGDLCSAASTSNYYQDLQDELRCQPLEEHTGHEVQLLQTLREKIFTSFILPVRD